jgi:Putative abortive phage resistance protein AbiGi, antitoxin
MSVSMHGESLFHFTDSLDVIKDILNDGAFEARYCRERLVYEGDSGEELLTPELLVPMVSLCDYKLSEISHHALNYGHYGLGMKKQWAIDNGLNPVLYISKKSEEIRSLLQTMKDAAVALSNESREGNLGKKTLLEAQINISKLIAWTKNYQGTLNRKGTLIHDFRFADDKEWRYVARQKDISGEDDSPLNRLISSVIGRMRIFPLPDHDCPCCGKSILECKDRSGDWIREQKDRARNFLDEESINLKFRKCDITFIIVKSNDDRSALIDFFINNKYKSDVYSIAYMSSKIIVKDDLDLRELKPIA